MSKPKKNIDKTRDARVSRAQTGLLIALGAAVSGPLLLFSVRVKAVYALPKFLALALAAAAAWGCVWAAANGGETPRRKTALDWPVVVFLAVACVCAALSGDFFLSFVGRYRYYAYGLAAMILYALLYFAAAWSREPERPERLFRVIVAAAAAAGFLGILHRMGLKPFFGITRTMAAGRIVSTQGSPVYLGACLLMGLPLALHLGLAKSKSDKFLGWAGGGLGAAGLLLTLTRSAWLGAVCGCAAYLFLSGRLSLLRRRAAWLGGAALAALAGAAVAGAVMTRSRSLSDSARLQLWASGVKVLAASPLVGTGPAAFEGALRRRKTEGFVRALGGSSGQANAHNDFLQVLCTMGGIGLAAYIWLLWGAGTLLARALAAPPRRDAAAASGGALIGLFIFAKFNPTPLASLAIAAVLCGLLVPTQPKSGGDPVGWLVPAAAAVSVVLLLVVFRLARADHHQLKAVVFKSVGDRRAGREFARAAELNPLETDYRMARSRFLYAEAKKTPERSRAIAILQEAVRIGKESVRLRPLHIDSYQIYGTSLILLARRGGPQRLGEAQAALDHAQTLDPSFVPLMVNRAALARMMGADAKAAAVEKEKERIIAMTRRSP